MFTELIENETTQKHRAEAEAAGLVLIGTGKNRAYRMFQFLDCEHKQEIQTSHIRTGRFRCCQCLDQKLNSEANAAGLILIGSSVRGNLYRTYKFQSCGHEQEFGLSKVREKNIRCQQCFDKRLENEAVLAGMTLIGTSNNANHRTYKMSCGHICKVETGKVRKGTSPTCPECGDNHYTKQSHLYLVEFTKGENVALKLGIANNLDVRAIQWACGEGVSFKIKALWQGSQKLNLMKIEKHIHSKSGIPRLSPDQGKEFVGSGYTEFYSTDKLNELIEAASDPKHGLLRLQ